jgi:hypothetical protein
MVLLHLRAHVMDGGPQVVYYYCLVKTKREGKQIQPPFQ